MRWNHLPLFAIHNLAMISDWMDEKGELMIDRHPHTGMDEALYLVRSMQDLRSMVLAQSRWQAISFTVFRENPLPLRGKADKKLLEDTLQQFPDGHPFYVARFVYYPEPCFQIAQGITHELLLRAFEVEWGHPIAIGPYEPLTSPVQSSSPTDIFGVARRRDHQVRRNQDAYAPYDADPARYQWIVDMWKE